MPVLIRGFSWTQTRDLICLRIPVLVPGVPSSGIDLFLAPDYFKLSYPVSHILELFLEHPVAAQSGVEAVEEGGSGSGRWIRVDLRKQESGKVWTGLEKNNLR